MYTMFFFEGDVSNFGISIIEEMQCWCQDGVDLQSLINKILLVVRVEMMTSFNKENNDHTAAKIFDNVAFYF